MHVDHFLAVCPDEPFHFVVMLGPANMAFGFANYATAKRIYVSEEKADEMVETASEFIRGIS